MRQHEDKVRLSMDISVQQHAHLKMQAAKKGLSMREYILEALAYSEERNEKTEEIDPESFSKALKKLRKEKYNLAKNLSNR
jgi:hypothetical protein